MNYAQTSALQFLTLRLNINIQLLDVRLGIITTHSSYDPCTRVITTPTSAN